MGGGLSGAVFPRPLERPDPPPHGGPGTNAWMGADAVGDGLTRGQPALQRRLSSDRHRRRQSDNRSRRCGQHFWLGVLVGIIIGAVGATIYSELSSAPEKELLEGALAEER
jgi:hypothetical protein